MPPLFFYFDPWSTKVLLAPTANKGNNLRRVIMNVENTRILLLYHKLSLIEVAISPVIY